MKIEDHMIEISNEEKIFFPADGITKGEVIEYYKKIAPYILPNIDQYPLVMQRFPDGIEKEGFFQRTAPDYFPEWINTYELEKKEGGFIKAVVAKKAEDLVYLADQGCLTFHYWLSKVKKIDYPSRMIFDLDPPSLSEFENVKKGALFLKKILEKENYTPLVMTTGSKGLHVIVSLDEKSNYEEIRKIAKEIVAELVQDHREFTSEIRKEKRKNAVFVDIQRNAYGQTGVVPYSIRPLEKAPVATPLNWEELEQKSLHPQAYTIKNIFKRLGQKEDPWKGGLK